MRLVKIDDHLSIMAQPSLADFARLAEAGFGRVINARPDGEEPGQLGNSAEANAARDADLDYSFLPVTGSTITEADIRAFQQALAATKRPVVAHCQTGLRALTLHVLGEVLDCRMSAGDVEAFGVAHGMDLSGAARWLAREATRVPRVRGFFDPRTGSVQYVVSDPATKCCAIIDPVLDFDEKSGSTATSSADALLAYVETEGLTVQWILDTHPHADHFSAAPYIKKKTGAPMAIGAHVTDVQLIWKDIYDLATLPADGSQWDRLFADGDTFTIGSIEGRALFSPGHTQASVTYLIGDAAFVHDTVFMPDSGTARADFPGGDAKALWASIQAILSLPGETRLFTGHDYQPGGRHPRWESTVADQARSNPHLAGIDEAGFVRLREARDRTLPMPKLILPAIQVNIRGGRLPPPAANGTRYLKLPIDRLEGAVW
ncbi:bifunctional sulfur transferase/dioxygenase Blh [Luteibacter aegosomatis]|uniref:bifunctional sulfur transferase/dioxygenase Blh n=1 Tax=Luteibacter aegosomatis TaxID=2911537 RepID=UPI001FF9068A|nr:bifunctional sulfur transferase/dioxygenase Blh [Luteibacter aegosomatis]UPG83896.1 bifunctional sulfur transferase/dioxygenase Blh [Luteibacter aegosomatis]